jgi:hypothetical protein
MAYQILNAEGKPVKRGDKALMATDIPAAVKAVDVEGRTLHITGTTEARDRDGDVITIAGWQLDNYKKNPVFLWGHDYRAAPIGRTVKVVRRRDPSRLDFEIMFPRAGTMPFADMILDLYDQKIINASSVGFMPVEWEDLQPDPDNPPPLGMFGPKMGRRYKKHELLELSGCSVPSNPEALQNAIKGMPGPYADMAVDFSRYLLGQNLKLFKGQAEGEPGAITGGALELIEPVDVVFEDEPKGKSQVQVSADIGGTEDPPPVLEEGAANGPLVAEVDIDKDLALKPYPQEHACRMADPDTFDKFRRQNCQRKVDGKCVDAIWGIKGDNPVVVQAFRYPKADWTVADAKNHCKAEKGILFEPAAEASVADLLAAGYDVSCSDWGESTAPGSGDADNKATGGVVEKVGAVLNKKNKDRLIKAAGLVREVLDEAEPPAQEGGEESTRSLVDKAEGDPAGDSLYHAILVGGDLPAPRKVAASGKRVYSEQELRDIAALGRIVKTLAETVRKLGA